MHTRTHIPQKNNFQTITLSRVDVAAPFLKYQLIAIGYYHIAAHQL